MKRYRKMWASTPSAKVREQWTASYNSLFFNLWLNKYKVEGMSRDEREFVLRRLWNDGAVLAFRLVNTGERFEDSDIESYASKSLLGYAGYAPGVVNMYYRPIKANAVSNNASPYVPTETLIIGENAVIISATHTFDPIKKLIGPRIDTLVDIEMKLRTNRQAIKAANMMGVTPDSSAEAGDLNAQLEDDEPMTFVPMERKDAITPISTASPLLVTDLYKNKVDYINEVLTILGINNTPFEKKERVLVDEVNSNNEEIEAMGKLFADCLAESCEEVKRVFGVTISFGDNAPEMEEPKEDPKEDKEEVEE